MTSIGYRAFYECSGLTSVTMPSSVTSISSGAFDGCNDLLFDTETVPGVKLVDGWAVGVSGTLSGHWELLGVRGIANCAFGGCKELSSVTIYEGMTSISGGAFQYCSGLTNENGIRKIILFFSRLASRADLLHLADILPVAGRVLRRA